MRTSRYFAALSLLLLQALAPEAQGQPAPRAFVRGDVDGDGFADVVAHTTDELALFSGSAAGLSERPRALPLAPLLSGLSSPRIVSADAWEDLDGDGRAEVILVVLDSRPETLSATAHVFVLSASPRAASAPLWSGSSSVPLLMVLTSALSVRPAGDVNGDGRGDMLAGEVLILAAAGGAALRAAPVSELPPPAQRPRAWQHAVYPLGDLDGDGRAELWVAPLRNDRSPASYGAVGLRGAQGRLWQLGAGGAWRARPLPLFAGVDGGSYLTDLRAADLDGDGRPELLGVELVPTMAINADIPGSVTLGVARRQPDGRYQPSLGLPASGAVVVRHPDRGERFLRCVADLDADGSAEVVTDPSPSPFDRPGWLVWDLDPGTWALSSRPAPSPGGPRPTVRGSALGCSRDVDGDGRTDLVRLPADRAWVVR